MITRLSLPSVALIKSLTLGTAVSAMAVGLLLAGEQISVDELVIFPVLTLLTIWMTIGLLKNVEEPSAPDASRRTAPTATPR